ncbi:odorant receptor 9a-like [Venturia canescens]|uniref:odorant receptor 9a-like n=1 Tax=Venturia canescens TaxID=32260 RepID=UPI001C9BEB68|nr:odorant receptor 9a-like [Venturia canescens]
MASLFNHSFYKWNKIALMIIGTWPEQPFLVRCLIPCFICANVLSMILPEFVYVSNAWPNLDVFLELLAPLCILLQATVHLLNCSFQQGKLNAILDHISSDWKRFGNSGDGEVLRNYADHGSWITKTYYGWMYSACTCYLIMPFLMPMVVEYFVPSNTSTGNIYLFNAYYGVNSDDYYWFILGHMVWESWMAIIVMISNDALLFVFVEHSCALFKIVEVNLKKVCSLDSDTKDSEKGCNYEIICRSIDLHGEAIIFTSLIDSAYNVCLLVILGSSLLMLSVTQLQILMHLNEPGELIRFVSFAVAQIFRLYLLSVPGQKIMDHSTSIFDYAYSVNWHDLTPKLQKLFILIMIRSLRPCHITAGKIYFITMENYSAILRTSMSFFTVLSSLR